MINFPLAPLFVLWVWLLRVLAFSGAELGLPQSLDLEKLARATTKPHVCRVLVVDSRGPELCGQAW